MLLFNISQHLYQNNIYCKCLLPPKRDFMLLNIKNGLKYFLTAFLFVFLLQKTKGWPQMKKPVLDERVYP